MSHTSGYRDRLPISLRGTSVALALLILVYLLNTGSRRPGNAVIGAAVPVEQLAFEINGWQGKTTSNLESQSREILKLNSYVRRLYSKGSESVFLYIGHWTHQTGENQAAKHTPSLCLPANGWKIERLGDLALTVPFADEESTLKVNRIIGEIDRERYLIYYWFANGDEYYPQEWQGLLRVSWSALLHRRTDGGIFEISTRIENTPGGRARAEKTLNNFLMDFQPQIDALIAKDTRGSNVKRAIADSPL